MAAPFRPSVYGPSTRPSWSRSAGGTTPSTPRRTLGRSTRPWLALGARSRQSGFGFGGAEMGTKLTSALILLPWCVDVVGSNRSPVVHQGLDSMEGWPAYTRAGPWSTWWRADPRDPKR